MFWNIRYFSYQENPVVGKDKIILFFFRFLRSYGDNIIVNTLEYKSIKKLWPGSVYPQGRLRFNRASTDPDRFFEGQVIMSRGLGKQAVVKMVR